MSDFIVRPAKSLEEVSGLWWPLMKELEWNRDPADASTHYRVARDGLDWLLLVSRDSGKPEGCVVAFNFPNYTGWVGFFCLNESVRGKGHGRALWKSLEDVYRFTGRSVIGLDGVEQQVGTYERRGFKDCGLIHLMTRPSVQETAINKERNVSIPTGIELLHLKDVQVDQLAAYDLAHTGLDRRLLWPDLLSRDDAYGYALQSTSNGSPTLLGYVLVRRCEHGQRFGPLYAESYDQASILLVKAMEHNSSSPGSMVAEIFGANKHGKQLFEEHGWSWANLDYHRMWFNGKVPNEQAEGGRGTRGMYATFDAAEG
ncbi:hypothetical protein K491DRAFT_693131 [Lophiostoma macrostomum CBS 122681]|uniref:N-acetyltransferase domain-containing protein n=1 Tax=Lophiostoma macrostomum CBS 122681 TaxID=1314788 RepID=A0A6A6T5V3_9PLEO|nr:hypothetical protein K491DRAFT_693131 [Lophiostoma macrostomum CBS 122681]